MIQDRFDKEKYQVLKFLQGGCACCVCVCVQKRSVEDIKERYYSVCNRLIKARGVEEGEMVAFDAPHEVKRKMQVE